MYDVDDHLPECIYSPGQPGFGGINSGIPATQPYIPGSPCICPALRACEQRVREEEYAKRRDGYALNDIEAMGYRNGLDAGLDAAREAVERVSSLLQPLGPALTAIDALREGIADV